MVHNGLEYGMLQAYGEGCETLNASKEYNLDLHAIAHLYRQGHCAERNEFGGHAVKSSEKQ